MLQHDKIGKNSKGKFCHFVCKYLFACISGGIVVCIFNVVTLSSTAYPVLHARWLQSTIVFVVKKSLIDHRFWLKQHKAWISYTGDKKVASPTVSIKSFCKPNPIKWVKFV